jgi:hypothetical protein
MKRMYLLAVLTALAGVTLTGTATAATVSGVVVAKDPARHALGVASRGHVRTVRTARFARIAVGQRLTAIGATRTDGTFAARTVRSGARSRHVRFAAVVVRHEAARSRVIVSAGGLAFPLRLASRRSPAKASPGLAPGDKITVKADIEKSGLEAGKGDVKEVGKVELLKLAGIYLWKTKTGFDIAVLKRGLVHVRVPEGTEQPEFAAGDLVLIVVSVGDGAFTHAGGHTETKPGEKPKDKPKDEPREAVEIAGVLAEKGAGIITIVGDDSTVVCKVPAALDLSLFRTGEKVKAYCKKSAEALHLHWLKSERGQIKDDGRGEAWFSGTLSDAAGVTVKLEDESSVTCPLARPLDLSAFKAGDKVKLTCAFTGGKLAFASLRSEHASINADGEVGASGLISAIGSGSVSVGSLTCAMPAGLDVAGIAAGQKAALTCKAGDGALRMHSLQAGEVTLKSDGTAERYVYGTFAERGAETVTVKRDDSSTFSCSAPASLDLSKFAVGDRLKMRCLLREGAWRLSLLRSDKASIEVPL